MQTASHTEPNLQKLKKRDLWPVTEPSGAILYGEGGMCSGDLQGFNNIHWLNSECSLSDQKSQGDQRELTVQNGFQSGFCMEYQNFNPYNDDNCDMSRASTERQSHVEFREYESFSMNKNQ